MDQLIQAVMFCGQDKNRRTILMAEKSMEDICAITRHLATAMDSTAAADFRQELWKAFTGNQICRGHGESKVYFKPVTLLFFIIILLIIIIFIVRRVVRVCKNSVYGNSVSDFVLLRSYSFNKT